MIESCFKVLKRPFQEWRHSCQGRHQDVGGVQWDSQVAHGVAEHRGFESSDEHADW